MTGCNRITNILSSILAVAIVVVVSSNSFADNPISRIPMSSQRVCVVPFDCNLLFKFCTTCQFAKVCGASFVRRAFAEK